MNSFWVEFRTGTNFDDITAGLKAVPAFNISEEGGTWYFDAEWRTDPKSLNNLRGRIETGSGPGSVTGIGVQDDSSSDGE